MLVADDDPVMVSVVSSTLSNLGASVVRATNGAELLQVLAYEDQPELVVTDVSMPWMTGLQVVASARTAGLDVPVIVISGVDDPNLEAQVAALGPFVRLIRKPFVLEDLEDAYRDLIGALSAA